LIQEDKEKTISIYRTPQFERCLDDLRRKKGGTAAMAARKADEFISGLVNGGDSSGRKKFSYTWNGEYRIKNCRKIDLVGAYRLVLIQMDHHFIFLYAGSHDDCFRWIEGNKGLAYTIEHAANVVRLSRESSAQDDDLPPDVLEQRRFIEQYEEKFMLQLDENTLLKIFPGWYKRSEDSKT
jgi:hypothetical protein